MRLLLVIGVLTAAPAFAEAGLPNSWCGEASCSCGAATCGCGQVCNLNQQRCDPAQTGFCGSDAQCAGSCDKFICEMNVCVRGARDGGSVPDGGGNGGGSNPPGGCSSAAGPLGAALLALLIRLTKR
jgi:hypothetical protein